MRRSGLAATATLLLLASACSASSLGAGAAPTPVPPIGRGVVEAPAPAPSPDQPTPITATAAHSPALAASVGPLRMGDRGPAVVDLQQRLLALGFWHNGVDGAFGPSTYHAVTALQKYWGLSRDGVVGPQTWAALDRNERPRPFITEGHLIEVDPRRQLVIVADNGWATWVLDSSTGAVAGSTPSGFFHVFREVNGDDPGPNGVLYRPKYFYQGVAVHGYPSVPAYPASHGCVRVTIPAMDMLWASGALPIGALVWVY